MNIHKFTLLTLPIALLLSCSTNEEVDRAPTKESSPVVALASCKAVEHSDRIQTTGRLSFNNEYAMSFKSGGVVEAVYVKEGQRVKAGKLLASLNPSEIEAKTSQAEIEVQKAKRDYERTEALYADSVATLEQLQNTESQWQNAQQNLRAAQFNQKQSRITAPSNGVIQKVLMRANEITGAGNPILIFGAEDEGKVLVANVSDVDVIKLAVGDKAILQFDAWQGSSFQGELIEIAGMANASTGTFQVKIQVDDPDDQLRPGLIGSAIITSSIVNRWIEIPIESLVQANNTTGLVYKVKNELATEQEVHISRILNEKLLVSAGLSADDELIVEGFARLTGDSIPVRSSH